MKLTGNLKKQVEKAETREAARETIAQAGMLLNDEELDQVAGGTGKEESQWCACSNPAYKSGTNICIYCGKEKEPGFGMYF